MLSLAPALASPPKVLVADEPTLGLAPLAAEEVIRALGEIRDLGSSILLVEEKAREVMALADVVAFMELGQVVWVGPRGSGRRGAARRCLPGWRRRLTQVRVVTRALVLAMVVVLWAPGAAGAQSSPPPTLKVAGIADVELFGGAEAERAPASTRSTRPEASTGAASSSSASPTTVATPRPLPPRCTAWSTPSASMPSCPS